MGKNTVVDNMSDKVSTEFNQETEQGFDAVLGSSKEQEQTEKEDSGESSAETNREQQEDSSTSEAAREADKQDDNVPFHQHPRWKEVYQKAKKVDELEARLAELSERKVESPRQESSSVSVKPKWFTDVYGAENEEAWRDYRQSQDQLLSQAESRAVDRIRREQKEEGEKLTKANDYIKQSVEALREEGHQFDENKLMKVMAEYRPVDESGTMWDFKRGMEIYALLEKKPSADAKKRVAASTMKSKQEADEEEVKVYTPSMLRQRYGMR